MCHGSKRLNLEPGESDSDPGSPLVIVEFDIFRHVARVGPSNGGEEEGEWIRGVNLLKLSSIVCDE